MTTEEHLKVLEERKEKLMSRLAERNQERKNANNENENNGEEAQIDELMRNIKIDLDNKIVDSNKVENLQKFLGYSLANRRLKSIQVLLEEVRKLKISQKPATKFGGFSFGKAKAVTSAPVKEKNDSPRDNLAGQNLNINTIENLINEKKVIDGKKDEDLSLKNIENSRLEFNFEPSVVHIRNIKNTTLLFSRCDRSILMHDCENVHLYVAAQQIRLHTSKNIHLHVATRGAVILEETTNCFMYGYRAKHKNGDDVIVEDNFEWKSPRDFDWLAKSQSPNWKLVSEDEYTTETFSF